MKPKRWFECIPCEVKWRTRTRQNCWRCGRFGSRPLGEYAWKVWHGAEVGISHTRD